MSVNIRIEKDVPMPVRSNIPELPLEKMEIGESFVLKLSTPSDPSTLRQRIHRFQKNNPPKKFSMRKIDDGSVRIFRVEDEE